MIREDWEFNSQHIVFPLAVTLLFVLVVVSKLTFGDWATAWNIGCFFVALATLLWMWADYSVRQSA
jgi:ABC-type transport system involved in cytochrome bd biosynthesis fused ATPase/permease subunit